MAVLRRWTGVEWRALITDLTTELNSRVTTAERDQLTAEAGDRVYNTDNNRLEVYDGSAWEPSDAESLAYTDQEIATRVPLDRSVLAEPLYVERSGKDDEDIFVTTSFFRLDGTLAFRSVLSGGTTPEYTTRTITEYASNGSTVARVTTLQLTYDNDGDLLTESVV